MALFTVSCGYVTQLSLHRHAAGVSHLYHLAGELEVLLQGAVRRIDHHTITAERHRLLHFTGAAAVIEMDRHRHLGLLRSSLHRRHEHPNVITRKVRFRQADNYRSACSLCRLQYSLKKIEAEDVKGSHRIGVIIGMAEHILHVYERHRLPLYPLSSLCCISASELTFTCTSPNSGKPCSVICWRMASGKQSIGSSSVTALLCRAISASACSLL